MAQPQGQDPLYRIGFTGGEKPYPDRGIGAGVPTYPDAESASPESQSPLADTPETTAPYPLGHGSATTHAADDVSGDDSISPPPLPSTPIESQLQHQPPTFLNLPLEIRLEIYSYLLTAQSTPSPPPPSLPPIDTTSPTLPSSYSSSSPSLSSSSSPLHPSILRTCRQLHAECIPVLYGTNTFLAHTSLLATFPSFFAPGSHQQPRRAYAPVRSPHLASLVTRYRVRVRLDAEPQFARDDVTAQFSGKAEVVIEAWQAEWRGAGPDVLRLFEGVRAVRTATVTGSTSGFEEYARWLERAMMAGVGDYVRPFAWDDPGLNAV
ncbi:hypothetical protein F5Y10DRAFT_220661 [Nemania abortiva]|nr:hypothetical protein F5Y10DRAFT_220661 [Nemania abortiva]